MDFLVDFFSFLLGMIYLIVAWIYIARLMERSRLAVLLTGTLIIATNFYVFQFELTSFLILLSIPINMMWAGFALLRCPRSHPE